MTPTLAPAAAHPPNRTSMLLHGVEDEPVAAALGRLATGLGLSALYGLALGARQGGAQLLDHAVGVPAGLLLLCAVATPALFIALSLFDAPLSAHALTRASADAWATSGLVLAGLAPAVALFVVTTESPAVAALVGAAGLTVGAAMGLRRLMSALQLHLAEADSATRAMGRLVLSAFAFFCALAFLRFWGANLAVLGGLS